MTNKNPCRRCGCLLENHRLGKGSTCPGFAPVGDRDWLPYCGVLSPPPGTLRRVVAVERRGQLFEEVGKAEDIDWRGVQLWQFRETGKW